MPRALLALLALLPLLLAGCANKLQRPVPLAQIETGQRVGVALAQVPKASIEVPGARCLACLVAAQAANLPLARHIDSLDTGGFQPLREGLAAAVRDRGARVTVIPDPIALESLPELPGPGVKRDFRALKDKYGIDKLVLVSVESHGVRRSYEAYVPTGAPWVFIRASGAMIDLASNTYEWYLLANLFKTADGDRWHEPPKYPGLTDAYSQALEEGKVRLMEPWSR